MLQSRFNWLKEPLIKFGEILAKYAEYLEHQQIRSKEIKNSLSLLTNELIKVEFWEPVNINEFCPKKRMQRFRFIEGLNLAFLFKVGIYKYQHKTSKRNSRNIHMCG